MNRPTIFVTGATGKTGTAIVTQLCEQGWPVRAVVRSEDERSESLRRLGAETVVADLFDSEQLAEAMRGTERAYYCPPFHPYMIQSAVAFAVAAREAQVKSVVGLSQWLASPTHPSLSTRQHWLVDKLLRDAAGRFSDDFKPWTFCRVSLSRVDAVCLALGFVSNAGRRREPECTTVERGYRAGCCRRVNKSGTTRWKNLPTNGT